MGYTTLRRYAVTLDDTTAGSRKISFLPYKVGTNVFATSSDWTPGAADFKVAKAVTGSGLGAEASIATAPTWVNGRVVIILSGTELTCRYLTIRIENAAINSDEIIVETYGNASAQYPTVYDGGSAGNPITSGTGADQLSVLAGKGDVGKINGVAAAATNLSLLFGSGHQSGSYTGSTVANTIDLGSLLGADAVNSLFFAISSGNVLRGWGVINQQFNSTTTSVVLDRALTNGIQNGDTWFIVRQGADTHETANSRSQVQVQGIDADKITATAIQTGALTAAKFAANALAVGTFAAGAFAQVQTMVDNLNQSASRRVTLQTSLQWERPEAGNNTYQIELRTYDGDGAPANATGTPTLTASGITSGSLAANLSAATNPATGVYRWTYTVAAAATVEQVRMDASATMADGTFTDARFTQVCDFVAATWTAADRTELDTILARVDVATSTRLATAAYTAPDNAGIASAATLASGAKTAAEDNATQIGIFMSRLGAFTGSGVNTVLGFLKAIFSSSAATPSDVGGTGTAASNSLQAIRNRGDAAWTTGAGGVGGGGTGTGATPVDHDGGAGVMVDGVASAPDCLRYVKPDTSGADGLTVYAYLASEYDASPPLRSPKGITRTGPDGRWVAPLMLDSGVYYVVADITGDDYRAKINLVEVP